MKLKLDHHEKRLIGEYWRAMPEDLLPTFLNKRFKYVHVTMAQIRDITDALSQGLVDCRDKPSAMVIVTLCERLERMIATSDVLGFCAKYNINLDHTHDLAPLPASSDQ